MTGSACNQLRSVIKAKRASLIDSDVEVHMFGDIFFFYKFNFMLVKYCFNTQKQCVTKVSSTQILVHIFTKDVFNITQLRIKYSDEYEKE